MKKRVSLIAIGDELLSGKIRDENLFYAVNKLTSLGIEVVEERIIGDDEKSIISALKSASSVADFVLVSGGLGPTEDDRTRRAVSKLLKKKLMLKKDVLKALSERFEKRGLPMPLSNRNQALFPEGAKVIPNPVGTAPGFSVRYKKSQIFFLPGVPSEFKAMLEDVIKRIGKGKCLKTKRFRIFGIPESGIADKLKGFSDLFKECKIAFLPSFPENIVDISVLSRDEKRAEKIIDEAGEWIKERIGDFIYSEGETLPEVIGNLLREMGFKIATAESCTGGLVSSLITDVPGSSDYFKGGIVSYWYEAKSNLLGVDSEFLEKNGAINERVAIDMAKGALNALNADIALSTTGILGPGKGGEREEVGTLFAGIAWKGGELSKKFFFPLGDRRAKKIIFSYFALDSLRRFLLSEKRMRDSKEVIEKAKKEGIAFIKKCRNGKNPLFFFITANPPTRAHREILIEAVKTYPHDEVVVMLDIYHADKSVEEASLEERMEMLRIAFDGVPNLSIGISSKGLFVEKLDLIREVWKSEKITFLVGMDTMVRILSPAFYQDPDLALKKLFENSGFIVAERKDMDEKKIEEIFRERNLEKYLNKIKVLKTPSSLKDISSTEVRERIKRNEPVSDLLLQGVEEFIRERKLYKG
jgi:nicotinamide-nucleotide amidase